MIKILFLCIFFYGSISASAATDRKGTAEADKKKVEEHNYKEEFTVHKNVMTYALTHRSKKRYFYQETDNGFNGIIYNFNVLEPRDTHLYKVTWNDSVDRLKHFLSRKALILPLLKSSWDNQQVPTWSKDLRRFIFVDDSKTNTEIAQEKFSEKPD